MGRRELVSDVDHRIDQLESIVVGMLEDVTAGCMVVDKSARSLGCGSIVNPDFEKVLTVDFLMRAMRRIATSPMGIAVARHPELETLGYGAISREWYVGCKEEGMIVGCWECSMFYTVRKKGWRRPKVYEMGFNWSEMPVKAMLICPVNVAVVGEGMMKLALES